MSKSIQLEEGYIESQKLWKQSLSQSLQNYENCKHYDYDADYTGEGWVESHGCQLHGECHLATCEIECTEIEDKLLKS